MSDVAEDVAQSLMGDTSQMQEQPAPLPEPQPQPEPPPPRAPDVPLATFLDLQAEARELRRFKAEQEARQAQQPQPDFYDNPEAVLEGLRAQMAEEAWTVRRDISAEAAMEKFGRETFDEARKWAEQNRSDQTSIQRFRAQSNPFVWLVNEFKRDRLLSDIGDDPDAYVRRRYTELEGGSGQPPAAAPAAARPATPPPSAPPRSLAAAPSASQSATAPASILEGAFSRMR